MLKRISLAINLRSKSPSNISSSSSAQFEEVYKNSEIINRSEVPTHLRRNSFVVPIDSALINFDNSQEPDISIDPFDSFNTLKRSKSLQFLPSKKLSFSNLRRKAPKAVHFDEQTKLHTMEADQVKHRTAQQSGAFSLLALTAPPIVSTDNKENGCEKTEFTIKGDFMMQENTLLTSIFDPHFLFPKDETVPPCDTEAKEEISENYYESGSEQESSTSGSTNSTNKSFFNFDLVPNEETMFLISQIRKEINPNYDLECLQDIDVRSTLELFLDYAISNRNKVEQMERDIKSLNIIIDEKNNQERQREKILTENDHLKERLEVYTADYASLQSKLEQETSKIPVLSSLNEDLNKTIEDLNKVIVFKTAENDQLAKSLQEIHDLLKSKGVSEGDVSNFDLTDTIKAISQVFDKKSELEEIMDVTISKSKSIYEQQQVMAESRILSLQLNINALESSIVENQEIYTANLNHLKTKNSQAINDLTDELNQVKEHLKQLEQEKHTLSEKAIELKDCLQSLISDGKSLSSQLELLAEENKSLISKNKQTRLEFEELDSGIAGISKSIAQLISDKDITINKLTSEMTNMKKLVHFLQACHRDSRKENNEQNQRLECLQEELRKTCKFLRELDTNTADIRIIAQTLLLESHREYDDIKHMKDRIESSSNIVDKLIKEAEVLTISNNLLVGFVRDLIEKIFCALSSMLLTESLTYIQQRHQVFKTTTVFDNSHQTTFLETIVFFAKAIKHLVDQYIENENYLNKELRARNKNYTHIMDSIYNGMLSASLEENKVPREIHKHPAT